ncbi:uncharacterized protein LOC117324532 [Pecten maximus]|uniref:uncharacterized protein LOC117324532 n=1 Tax=Pecten maximus TaxID=6579 RepID=UPI001457FB25|nr:uncharacterized protein LOC117324532 [Pecten maximus]
MVLRNMTKVFLRITLITCLVLGKASAAESCASIPKCVCEFPDGTKLPIEPNMEGNEALAGTVGALSSLIATGSGFGIWYLCKKRSLFGKFGRSSSNLSDQSFGKDGYDPKNPPPYSEFPRKRPETVSTLSQDYPRPESVRTTNVYRTPDAINMKEIGNRLSSGHYHGARSDWM